MIISAHVVSAQLQAEGSFVFGDCGVEQPAHKCAMHVVTYVVTKLEEENSKSQKC